MTTSADESGGEIASHFESTLEIEFPDFWRDLERHAPWAMDAYHRMRTGVFHPVGAEGTGMPKRYMELVAVALDILLVNTWGVDVHTRAAIRAGATLDEVREMVVLCIMSGGMVKYRLAGHVALEAAERAIAEMASGPTAEEGAGENGDVP